MVRKFIVGLLALLLVSGTMAFASDELFADRIASQKNEADIYGMDAENITEKDQERIAPPPGVDEMTERTWEGEGPPPWANPRAIRQAQWSREGHEGPPPWANPGTKQPSERTWEGQGPPPWANPRAIRQAQWSRQGLEGPPPWANGNPEAEDLNVEE